MNIHFLKILLLSLSLAGLHTAQAATLKNTVKTTTNPTPAIAIVEKQTPIEKALSQQKRGEHKFTIDNDQLKIYTSIKTAPTQNFLADQHQRFSRILQSLFQQQSS